EVERWQQAHIEINPNDTLSQLVKRKISTIRKMSVNPEGHDTFLINSFGSPSYYSSSEVFNFLGNNITDSYSLDEMLNKLESVKDRKPFVKEIINMVEQDYSFESQLYTTLASKTFQEYSIIYEKDGEYKIISANKTSL